MFYVRAKVHPEMKQKYYDVRLAAIVEQGAGEAESVVVTWAEFGCPTGRVPHGSCKHLAAVMYALESFYRLSFMQEEDSCTSKLQKWNQPVKKGPFTCPCGAVRFV